MKDLIAYVIKLSKALLIVIVGDWNEIPSEIQRYFMRKGIDLHFRGINMRPTRIRGCRIIDYALSTDPS